MRFLAILVLIAIIVFVVWAVSAVLTARRRSQGWQIKEGVNMRTGKYEIRMQKYGEIPMRVGDGLDPDELRTPEGQALLWELRSQAREEKIALDNHEDNW